MWRVLITDYVEHTLIEGLDRMGLRVVYAPEVESEQVSSWIDLFEGIVINSKTPIDATLMDEAVRLKFIGRMGAGLDIIDTAHAARRRITVLPTPGANANAVGEHMFGMLLALLRNIPQADKEVRQRLWLREKNRGAEIAGMTVGIIGFGNTGSAFARKFAGWATQIVAYDKYKRHYAGDLRYVEESTFEEVLMRSDVISLHVPLTSETEYLVDRAFLQRCRPGVMILNGSRGRVVKTEDLVKGLESGTVGGACLDVLEMEPPHEMSAEAREWFDRLVAQPAVLLTPHIAGWTRASRRNIARQMLEQIRDLHDGNTAG